MLKCLDMAADRVCRVVCCVYIPKSGMQLDMLDSCLCFGRVFYISGMCFYISGVCFVTHMGCTRERRSTSYVLKARGTAGGLGLKRHIMSTFWVPSEIATGSTIYTD